MSRAVVRLTEKGANERVLEGTKLVGMLFEVQEFTGNARDHRTRVAHVLDPRFDNNGRPQVWSLGPEHYTLFRYEDKGSGCECCDHKLQHIIRDFFNWYDNACPPVKVSVVIGNLRDALTQWEDDN